MNVLGQICLWHLEKKWKLFSRKLPNIIYYAEFYKTTLRHCKTTTLYIYLEQELNSDEIFHKACVPLGDVFGNRNCMYRHDNFQAIFYIIWLISDCPWKQLSPSHSHREDVIIKNGTQASHSVYCFFRTLFFVAAGVKSKSKTAWKNLKALYFERGKDQLLS